MVSRMYKIHISPEAARDLTEIKRYIAAELKNPEAAKRTVRAITSDLRTLERFPEAGPSIEALTGYATELRYYVCGKHLALYKVESDAVFDKIYIVTINITDDCVRFIRLIRKTSSPLHILARVFFHD